MSRRKSDDKKFEDKPATKVLASSVFTAADESRKSSDPVKVSVTDQVAARGMSQEPAKAGGDKRSGLVAKKDFTIRHNDYLRVIKAGDDVSDVPQMYHANLKTEGVL